MMVELLWQHRLHITAITYHCAVDFSNLIHQKVLKKVIFFNSSSDNIADCNTYQRFILMYLFAVVTNNSQGHVQPMHFSFLKKLV